MDSIACTKQKIRVVIAGSKVPEDPRHAENTLDWLLRLKSGADEALQIAALGHDIQRALAARKLKRADFPDYDTFKAAHARNSAEILGDHGRLWSAAGDVRRGVRPGLPSRDRG